MLVADFTYVKLVTGVFVYIAFVIDAYAGAIVGWEGSARSRPGSWSPRSARPPHCAPGKATRIDGAIHHSDAGSQYTACVSAKHCPCRGCGPRSAASAMPYDNALAETTIGLYKNECIRADSPFRRGPLRTLADVELITADYVAWYNQQRLMHRLGRIPPAEAEAHYYAQLVTGRPAGSQNPEGA